MLKTLWVLLVLANNSYVDTTVFTETKEACEEARANWEQSARELTPSAFENEGLRFLCLPVEGTLAPLPLSEPSAE